jgi:hypothetical protein
VNTCALEHGGPVHELGGARVSVPGSAFGVRVAELDEIALERPLEPGNGRLGSLCCPP